MIQKTCTLDGYDFRNTFDETIPSYCNDVSKNVACSSCEFFKIYGKKQKQDQEVV